jgi:glucan 1,3-beta-glucosidase
LLAAAETQGSHPFWMEVIKHTGDSPFLNDSSYVVYRNVKDYGAKGDGIADDTAAIQSAIDGEFNSTCIVRNSNQLSLAGGRCYNGCGPGTVAPAKSLKPALIYVPSGTYRITSTLKMYIFTQLVGNPLDMPVIKADSTFTGRYLLDGFPAPVNSTMVTTIVFYMQLRNFVFDTTAVDPRSTVACINWATAQAVTLSNNHLIMTPGSMHQGIAMNGTNGGGGGSATYMGILARKGS